MAQGSTDKGVGSSGSRGRPRDPAIDTAILDVTIRLLASSGVDGTTMEKVASEAGTSKVTVYSRFRGKDELIGAALSHLQLGHLPPPSGNAEDDLVALLVAMRQQYADVDGMSIVGACLTSEARSSEFLEIVRASTLWPRRAAFAELVQRGVDHGELVADIDIGRVVSMIIGCFYADYLAGREMASGWERSVVRSVLAGVRADPFPAGDRD